MTVSHSTEAWERHWGFGLGQTMVVGVAVPLAVAVSRVVVTVGLQTPYSGRQPVPQ